MPLPLGPPSSLPPSLLFGALLPPDTAKLDFLASSSVGIRKGRFILLTLQYTNASKTREGDRAFAAQKTCCPSSQCHTACSFFRPSGRPSVSNDVAAISRRRRYELNLFLVFETNDGRPRPAGRRGGRPRPSGWLRCKTPALQEKRTQIHRSETEEIRVVAASVASIST